MSEETDRQEGLRKIHKFVEELGEHFEAVQILASVTEGGCTHSYAVGSGNWYARQGMAREFIEKDTAQTNALEIGQMLEEQEDGT